MKYAKYIFLLFLIAFVARPTKAATITIVDPDFKTRFAGSVVLETNTWEEKYWYIDPQGQERFWLKDGISVTRLLKKLAVGIRHQDLLLLPGENNTGKIDYNLVAKFRGKFLLDIDRSGQAWYLNPLDSRIYAIANGQDGYNTLKKLSLELSAPKVALFKIAADENFAQPDMQLDFSMWDSVRRTLKNNYYDPSKISDQDLFYGVLKGMAESVNDPYTEFFSPAGKQNFDNTFNDSVEGIGAMVDISNSILVIISPLKSSPAEKAGLLPNDQILEVNSQSIEGLTLNQATNLIKGPSGTVVKLKIFRPTTQEYFVKDIVREKITVPNISEEQVGNGILYFKINLFSQNTAQQFNNLLKQKLTSDTRGLIIDLRNNPGGYTDEATALADIWLPKGKPIFQERYPDRVQKVEAGDEANLDVPTIILVNAGTASASEIFSGALQVNQKAKLVGVNTFGKSTGQTFSNYPDGSALKYTIFEWLTADGSSIFHKGLTPDFVIKNIADGDQQKQKAIELLN